jgi:very-short-patch-repair endonuclease
LTPHQWRAAALLYGGADSALSHRTAGEYWGLGVSTGPVHVTVPAGRHLRSIDEVQVHQSERPFHPWRVERGLFVTPPARTALDIALGLQRLNDVTAIFGRGLQRGYLRLDELAAEVDAAPRRGSKNARIALADMAAGSRSVAESRLLYLLRRERLPLPELNAPVKTAAGVRYVNALWRALGKGVEVDGQAFHLDAASWAADLTRQNELQTEGILLLRITARRLWTEPEAVVAEIRAFLGC